jgi:glycosyltransferase involved in cell wall biosynthesis
VVLFVGAMDAAHDLKGGVPVLLRAIAKVADPRTTLLLVGGGDKVSSYAALARQLGIAGQTRFGGWVPHDALGPYYAAADVVVLPSVRTEAFGMVVIEALACARAVIASDLPGLRTVVGSTQGGVLVPPGDAGALATAIRDLLSEPSKRRLMGERGRLAVERLYAWPRVTQRLIGVYRDVLEDAATRQVSPAVVG